MEVLFPHSAATPAASPRNSFTVEADPPARSGVADLCSKDGGGTTTIEFEFCLDDPAVGILTADELFSGGKLVPLHVAAALLKEGDEEALDPAPAAAAVENPPPERPPRSGSAGDPFAPSPRAPTCAIRWRQLLGLRKRIQAASDSAAAAPPSRSRPAKLLSRRCSRSASMAEATASADPSIVVPLLQIGDPHYPGVSRSTSSSSSSTSSSSGGDLEDQLPRLSIRLEKPIQPPPPVRVKIPSRQHRSMAAEGAAARQSRRAGRRAAAPPARGASVDSPRLNASGKVVFYGLERSTSSPSSLRYGAGGAVAGRRHNVRVATVLNVPGSFAIGQLFQHQQQRKEKDLTGGTPKKLAAAAGGGR